MHFTHAFRTNFQIKNLHTIRTQQIRPLIIKINFPTANKIHDYNITFFVTIHKSAQEKKINRPRAGKRHAYEIALQPAHATSNNPKSEKGTRHGCAFGELWAVTHPGYGRTTWCQRHFRLSPSFRD